MKQVGDDRFVDWRWAEIKLAKKAGLRARFEGADSEVVRFKPIGCKVLARLDEKLDKFRSDGVLVIPDSYKRQPLIATVLAVGHGHLDEKGKAHDTAQLQPGDRIYLGPYNGIEVQLDDEHEYRVCELYHRDPSLRLTGIIDIYAVIENDDGTPYQGTPTSQELQAWMNAAK